jgi:hypothetical protein
MAVYNHPITIRLAPTNYAPFGDQTPVFWQTFTPRSFKPEFHGITDGVFPDFLIKVIPNNLYNIKALCDEPTNIDVLSSQDIEIQASCSNSKRPATSFNQGGAYIDDSRALLTQTINATNNAKNIIDLKGHAGCFIDYARPNGGTAFNLFIHGQCNREEDPNPLFESSTIPAPQGGLDQDGVFDNQDSSVSSHVTFKSSDAPITTSITSNLISFRKSLHYNFLKLLRSDMAGMSMASGTNGKAFVTASSSFNWGNVPGLSAESVCSINQYTSPTNEQASAQGGNPITITCSTWNGVFEGIFGNNARFRNSTSNSLFRVLTGTYEHTGKINATDPNYADGTSNPYTLSTVSEASNLFIRMNNAISYGNKNYLAIGPRSQTAPRFTSFPVGSYIRITGSSSNDGIYQVLSVLNGIPGDNNANVRVPPTPGTPLYEYLELSRAIVPEASASTKPITVQNVSHLPILHIRYQEPVNSPSA